MEFKSQICTNVIQSQRLIELGLKDETADMVLLREFAYNENKHSLYDTESYMIRPIDYLKGEEHRGHIMAWSLHRLLEICPEHLTIDELLTLDFPSGGGSSGTTLYDRLIDCIEWLIYSEHFNKKYLKEK